MTVERQDDRAIEGCEILEILEQAASDFAVFMAGPDGRVTSWRDGARRMFGLAADLALGMPMVEAIGGAEDAIRVAELLNSGGGRLELWLTRERGERFFARLELFPVRKGDAGSGYVVSLRDLGERMADERTWVESHGEAVVSVLDTALDGVVTIDREGRVVAWNTAAERMFGRDRREAIGRQLDELIIPPRMRSAHRRGLAKYLATGESAMLGKRLEVHALRADGSEFPIELAIVRVPTDEMVFTGYARDITERKTHEQRAAIQLAVAEVLSQAATIDEAAPRLLEAVGGALTWQAARLWLSDRSGDRLLCKLVLGNVASGFDADPLRAVTPTSGLAADESLPGRVWQSGQMLFAADLPADDPSPHSAAVAELSLRSALATPLQIGPQTLGVIEFLADSMPPPSPELLELLTAAGNHAGQFIQRQRAEAALREGEERFRGLMEQAPFSIQILSPDGHTLQVNRAWEDLWGMTVQQLEDYCILQDPQLEAKGVLSVIREAFEGRPVDIPAICYEVDQTLPDRSRLDDPRRWISAVAYPLKGPAKEVREVVLVHIDISERKRTEDALRRSEERFRGIVSQSIAGFAEVGLDGQFQFANQRFCRIVGRTLEDLQTLRMQDITHPDDIGRNLEQFEKVVRDGVPFILEKRYVRPDGSAVWVSASVSGLRGMDGRVSSVVAACVDVTDRRRADEARRAGEERLRTLIDNLPHGAIYRAERAPGDAASRFTYLSAGVERILGVTAEEGLADPTKIYTAIHPEDADRVRAEEERALERMEQFNSEFRIYMPSGAMRWLHCRSAPSRHPNGEIAWEGVMLDVTEVKLADQTLRENEERLRLALEAGGMRAWLWDIRSDAMRWSPQPGGLAPNAEPTESFESFQKRIHPDDRAGVVESIGETLRAGSEHHIEFRAAAPGGGVRWIESRGTLVRNLTGSPLHMMGVDLDVTSRKLHEEDLKFLAEASRSLATLVDYESTMQRIASLAVPHFADWCVVHVADEPGVLRQLAVAHVDPTKIAAAAELNSRWPPDPDAPGGIYEVYRTGQSLLVEDLPEELLRETIRDRDQLNTLLALGLKSYICVPLAARGQTVGVLTFAAAESGRRYTAAELSIAEDLGRRAAIASENARLYAAVREEARRKDEFLAMLAHELRNPLAPIRSGLDLLKLQGVDGEILATMQQQVEHLVRLVDDLLDVSRIMRGKVELRREPVELSSVVTRAVDTVRSLVEQHKQTLTVDVDPSPAWLMADPVRIAQVIGNLLNNASKYTERGGQISLMTAADESTVTVRVGDNGIGISRELLPHVFDLFTQDQRSIDRSQGGLGIGLTVVKNMVEMHGGSVTVRSEGPGKGSEFTVRLPRIATPQRLADTTSVECDPGSLHILVVDDNVAAATMLSMLLRTLGPHEVYTAYDGPSAIQEAVRSGPDLVLLDIGLPGLDGFEVARRMRELPELGGVRLVAVTGYGTAEDRRKSFTAGFDEHLVKPPSIDAVRQILSRVRR